MKMMLKYYKRDILYGLNTRLAITNAQSFCEDLKIGSIISIDHQQILIIILLLCTLLLTVYRNDGSVMCLRQDTLVSIVYCSLTYS